MSTRCHIRIKDGRQQFKIYHHCDGYPEGVGQNLKEFLKEYDKGESGNGRRYWWGAEIANRLIKGAIKIQRLDLYSKDIKYRIESDDGYEITEGVHGDEEYVYVINCKKRTLTCYSMSWGDSFEETIRKKRIVEIPEPEVDEAVSQNPF